LIRFSVPLTLTSCTASGSLSALSTLV